MRTFSSCRSSFQHAGFTLIEVLVALVIAVSAFGALVGIFSKSLRTVDTAAHFNAATTIAQSKLAEVLAVQDLEEGGRSGEIEDTPYKWTATVTALPDPVPPAEGVPVQQFFRVQMLEVTVRVTWEEARSIEGTNESSVPNVTLSTVRVAGKKAS
jgi:prepilin-type N-terminal cleavage/methylation domain-containing protein